jgi:hypothetical protein
LANFLAYLQLTGYLAGAHISIRGELAVGSSIRRGLGYVRSQIAEGYGWA